MCANLILQICLLLLSRPSVLAGGTPSTFVLADNGVTVLCTDAAVGESGTVNGITYTKRTKNEITLNNAATTCTSGITDMSSFFDSANTFNADISHWDTSQVTNMQSMFNGATSFNQPIGEWDTSQVTNMVFMFLLASSFDQDLTGWCVSQFSEEPPLFADNSGLSTSNLPKWGTCPS